MDLRTWTACGARDKPTRKLSSAQIPRRRADRLRAWNQPRRTLRERASIAMHRSFQLTVVLATCALLAMSFIGGLHPADQPLLHIPTIVALFGLMWLTRRGSISDASLVCIVAFLWLHILGARYVYSFVPYDHWSRACFGVTVSDWFGFTRNHYDRFVHFAYGVLAIVPQMELLRRTAGIRAMPACLLSVAMVLAAGSLYEVFEWLLTLVVNPAHADRYNGQQGDAWDAQKDMACALLGALPMSMFVLALCRRDHAYAPAAKSAARPLR